MSRAMLACGCASIGTVSRADGYKGPGCIIHECFEVIAPPNLTERMAKCSYACKSLPRPSDPDKLAFFKYQGPGSREATDMCVCGYAKIAHDDPERRKNIRCREFRPKGPQAFDRYYCGCRGWD